MNLTRLVRQINVHGAKLGVQYHGGIPEFTTRDVYAAMGMGHLDTCVCAMGLTINELGRNNNCMRCHGTGSKNYRECTRCKGSGKSPMTVTYKCTWLNISRDSWRTWGKKYDLVYKEFGFWLDRWERHVLARIGG